MSITVTTNKFRSVSKALRTRPDILQFLQSDRPMKDLFEFDVPLSKTRLALYKQLYKVIEDTGCYKVHLPNKNLLRVKMECTNSMGNNHYARYWIPYLFVAEAFEVILPGTTNLIEVSSGSAGISLALACKELGYDLTLVIPDSLPPARIRPIVETGARIIKVSGYIEKCIDVLKELLSTGKYFAANHSEEPSNFIVHTFSRIAIEYYKKFGIPDYAILGTGNGTTTEAIFKYFRNKSQDIRLYSYHPKIGGEQMIFGLYGQDVKMRHVENSKSLTDRNFITNDMDISKTIDYFKNDSEILNLGTSSLYGIHLAKLIAGCETGKTIMTIGYDSKDRY